ncbi:MAG: hypothetical protein OXB95_07560 [Rhodobacteraceae bacterium]|nr:hypothetical protein [Paracoccaceae bacterium]
MIHECKGERVDFAFDGGDAPGIEWTRAMNPLDAIPAVPELRSRRGVSAVRRPSTGQSGGRAH